MTLRKERGLPAVPPETEVQHAPLRIPEDIFARIIGLDDVKDLMRLALRTEKPVHLLLHGPPGSAKSLFLAELARIRGACTVLGSSSSRAGLLQVLLEQRPRLLIIDELDKIRSNKDYAVLLSLMEDGAVSITLYGRQDKVTLDTRVFGAANSIAHLPAPLLSRFMPIRFMAYTPEEFLSVATGVLTEQEQLSTELARDVAVAVQRAFRQPDIRDVMQVGALAREDPSALARIIEVLQNRR